MSLDDFNSAAKTPTLRVADEHELFGKTLRTIAVLVGACVLFVGTLSTAAVFLASKAVGPSAQESTSAPSPATTGKKPLSI